MKAHIIGWQIMVLLVLFNRFYQPNFDLEQMAVTRALELSVPEEIRTGLLWIAVLYRKLGASLAASTGVEGPAEVVKYLMAGADAVMTTSSLLRHGVGHLGVLRDAVDVMKRYPKIRVQITGHTDSQGYDTVNERLSQARANAVRTYLLANMALPEEQIQAVGYGETNPVASNDTAEGRAKNRRIDIVLDIGE